MSVSHKLPARNNENRPSSEIAGNYHRFTLPWPAQRIRLRHGLTHAAALIVATEAGFVLEGEWQ
jgi:hypothetical protein